MRRATAHFASQIHSVGISIHALLAESDIEVVEIGVGCLIFLSTLSLRRATNLRVVDGSRSTLSLRRATCYSFRHSASCRHFYPRSPCGERPVISFLPSRSPTFLSTLSLRRATTQMQAAFKGPEISIHALLAESDGPRCKGPWACFPFLSTLSLRRATIRPHQRHFAADISIHALLAESDEAEDGYKDTVTEFLSTLSLRRATVEEVSGDTWTRDFYPRSPCGERPRLATRSRHYPMDFYPRSPCGERHDTSSLMQCQAKFLSTLSLRRATVIFRKRDTPSQFLSTLSLRRATVQPSLDYNYSIISIHALLAESDRPRR